MRCTRSRGSRGFQCLVCLPRPGERGRYTARNPSLAELLHYFRPGEEFRRLARCQFGLSPDGKCGAVITYPIAGYPWRRNPMKSFNFQVDQQLATELFCEIQTIRERYPSECLIDNLWSDTSEKANGITRDVATNTLCYTVGIYDADGNSREYYSLRENSSALLTSRLYDTVSGLIADYETI